MTLVAVLKPDRPGDLVLASPAIRAIIENYGVLNVTLYVASETRRLAEYLFPDVASREVDFPLLSRRHVTAPHGTLGRELDEYGLIFCLCDDPALTALVRSLRTQTELIDGDDGLHETLIHKIALRRRLPDYSRTAMFSGSQVLWPERVDHVALALESTDPFWVWPLSSWLKLAVLLADDGVFVSIVVGPRDRAEARVLSGALGNRPHTILDAGDDPGRLYDGLSDVNLVVGADGDLVQLCSLKKPTVTIFGATSWRRRSPFGWNNLILSRDLPCSPCVLPGNGKVNGCTTRECTAAITAEDLFAVVGSTGLGGAGAGVLVVRGASHLDEMLMEHTDELRRTPCEVLR